MTVNGVVVRELGSRADPVTDDVRVDGRRLAAAREARYILLYKPKGYVTTRHDPEGRPTVIELLGPRVGYVYPVGRLDYDTMGLLLLTSDGDLAEHLTHRDTRCRASTGDRRRRARRWGHGEAAAGRLHRRAADGQRRRPARPGRQGRRPDDKLVMTLHEGRNRQVRKMCAAIGHPVRALTRVQMGPLTLGRLRPGEWRDLRADEVAALRRGPGEGASPVPAGRPAGPRTRDRDRRAVARAHDSDAVSSASPSSSGSISSGTARSISTGGGSNPSCWAMSSIFGRSDRSFKPKRMRNSRVVP